MKRYILTGTPGSGKTSLLRALEIQGCFVVEEAATDMIAYNQANGIAEPWNNPNFIDDIVRLQKQRQIHTCNDFTDIQYFDRSPICTFALALYLRYEPSPILLDEIDRILSSKIYQSQVFFIENLGFCTPTEARKINYEEALIFERMHLETYEKFGFKSVMIPPAPLEKRINLIASNIIV